MDTELIPVGNKTRAAEITGLAENRIVDVAFQLDFLRRNGLLIDIRVSGVSMFVTSAQLSEFGIAKTDEKARRYTAGSKFIIPKTAVDRIRSVETRMRQLHVKYCSDVVGFRPYRWLPYTGYQEFKAKWAVLHNEFVSIKNDILANLDGYRDQLADEFAGGARTTWQAIQGQGYNGIIFNGAGYYDKYDFIDAVVAAALAQFPSANRIEAELQADYQIGVIWTDFDEAKLAIASDMAYATAKSQKEIASLKAAQAQEDYDHTRRMNQLEQHEKELKIEAMMKAELDHAKAQLAEMNSPFEEVFLALRSQIALACEEIRESLDKNGFLKGKVAERAAGLVELYDLLAAHNDAELRTKLVELKSKIGGIGQDRGAKEIARSPEAIRSTLKDIIDMANIEADELANMSRAAFLEV